MMGACVAAAVGCTNASNPTLNPTRSDFYQTESKTIFVPGSGLLLSAFVDQQGVLLKSGNNLVDIQPHFEFFGGALRWVGQSFGGLSASGNLGPGAATGLHFFGDYESTAFLFDGTPYGEPIFVTTFARSSQCAAAGQLTRDQFVGSVIW